MKLQSFGWSKAYEFNVQHLLSSAFDHSCGDDSEARAEAVENYKASRMNGDEAMLPTRPMPNDGKYTDWIKCLDKETLPSPLRTDGGWEGGGWYRIRYDEGRADRAWMESIDRRYIASLYPPTAPNAAGFFSSPGAAADTRDDCPAAAAPPTPSSP